MHSTTVKKDLAPFFGSIFSWLVVQGTCGFFFFFCLEQRKEKFLFYMNHDKSCKLSLIYNNKLPMYNGSFGEILHAKTR